METEEALKKTVLIAPLNWGLGHASRIIPLIDKYKTEGWRVILASDGDAFKFLEKEYPDKSVIDIGLKPLRYSKMPFLLAHLWYILPSFLKNIKTDKQFVEHFCNTEKVDLIISDNRYGFRHKKIKSIILTHQLQLPIPKYLSFGKGLVQKQLSRWLNTFDECWIIDDQEHSLAGSLSSEKSLIIPYQFLGLQSRLKKEDAILEIDFLVILSGIEPQRSILEKMIIEAFANTKQQVTIIGGCFDTTEMDTTIRYIPFANTQLLNQLINQSKCVIARSGYSTIMDLIHLNKKAILIPTLGQVEQEYLARKHALDSNFIIAENTIHSLQEKINNC